MLIEPYSPVGLNLLIKKIKIKPIWSVYNSTKGQQSTSNIKVVRRFVLGRFLSRWYYSCGHQRLDPPYESFVRAYRGGVFAAVNYTWAMNGFKCPHIRHDTKADWGGYACDTWMKSKPTIHEAHLNGRWIEWNIDWTMVTTWLNNL